MFDTHGKLQDHAKILADLGVTPNRLRRKYTDVGRAARFIRKGSGAANCKGQNGRSARRTKGWKKHGKGPANVPG